MPEEEKVYDRNTALEALKAVCALGYRILPGDRETEGSPYSMLVNICVSLSVGIFVAALAAALRNRHAVSRRITILLVGICLSSFCLFLPAYWELSCKGVEDGLAYPRGFGPWPIPSFTA